MPKIKSNTNSNNAQQYWLFKSEPSTYSFENMKNDVVTQWDGVRNYQAQNFMKTMKIGDIGFFYHSIKEKSIVGIIVVCKEHYMADDPKFGQVDVKFSRSLDHPVELKDLKGNPKLKSMLMLKQSRLSVSPLTADEWNEIIRMSEIKA